MSVHPCIFCGKRAGSEEHIFDTQFAKILAEDPRGFDIPIESHIAMKGGPIIRTLVGKLTKRTRVPTIPFTTDRVCNRCNNEWMARLGDYAASWVGPMIRGNATTIPSPARERVASWAARVAMSGRAAHDPPMLIEKAWSDSLYLHNSILPHWIVWIGRYDGVLPHFFYGPDAVIRSLPWPGSGESSRVVEDHSVCATFFIGYLIVQVFGAREGGVLAEQPWPGLVNIWPNDGATVEWASDLAPIGDATLWPFAERLGHPPELPE